jgi:hypothetical protein
LGLTFSESVLEYWLWLFQKRNVAFAWSYPRGAFYVAGVPISGSLLHARTADRVVEGVKKKEDAMSERRYDEKDEKLEKQDEKDEKGRGEKQRNDPLSAVIWALILIWAGLVFLAQNLGLLKQFELANTWGLIFIGAGLIVWLEVIIRLVMPEYRRPVIGTFIFGVILIGIGTGITFGATPQIWSVIFALAIIAAGVSILLRGLRRRR